MSGREKIQDTDLEEIVGGALRWYRGKVSVVGKPEIEYNFSDYYKCTQWIRMNWLGGKQDERCLKALEEAGLVWK